jgi:dUTP pyrophosphatase
MDSRSIQLNNVHHVGFVVEAGCSLPVKAHEADMGYDVCAKVRVVIPPYTTKPVKVPTGLCVNMKPGLAIQIQSRSGLAFNKGIRAFRGIIDSGYTGEIMVGLYNDGPEEYIVEKGDRIAQFCFYNVPEVVLTKISKCDETERGTGGFGSTGKSSAIDKVCDKTTDHNKVPETPVSAVECRYCKGPHWSIKCSNRNHLAVNLDDETNGLIFKDFFPNLLCFLFLDSCTPKKDCAREDGGRVEPKLKKIKKLNF